MVNDLKNYFLNQLLTICNGVLQYVNIKMLAKVRAVNMLFYITDLCIYVPILSPVTGFKHVGLS